MHCRGVDFQDLEVIGASQLVVIDARWLQHAVTRAERERALLAIIDEVTQPFST